MVTILDSHNLFYTVKSKFGPEHKLDYSKMFKPRSVVVGFEAHSFENFLRETGYEVYFAEGRADNFYSCAMLMAQAMRIPTDYIRLGSQDRNIVPLVEVLRGKGIYVEVLGAGIPVELRRASNKWTEIREEDTCITSALG